MCTAKDLGRLSRTRTARSSTSGKRTKRTTTEGARNRSTAGFRRSAHKSMWALFPPRDDVIGFTPDPMKRNGPEGTRTVDTCLGVAVLYTVRPISARLAGFHRPISIGPEGRSSRRARPRKVDSRGELLGKLDTQESADEAFVGDHP